MTPSRTLRITISYDGTDFFGWQVQPDKRTVQGELEKTLATILDEPVRIIGAGRTDRGVHALNQVASLNTERPIQVDALTRGLNSLLDPDVHVKDVREAPAGFHARYSATSRTYRYHLSRRPGPIRYRYSWIVPEAPDASRLALASEPLLGAHHFDAFTSGEGLEDDTACTVHSISWQEEGERVTMEIEADRFLFRMVRTIVGTLAGLHRNERLGAASVADLLAARAHSPLAVPAPPQGLFFVRASYPPDDQIEPTRPARPGLE